jgi:hypothetical protein
MANTYRFGDASKPGLLIGLAGRQALPLIGGVLWMAFTMQTAAPLPFVLAGPAVGVTVAFGRFRGAPLAEVGAPALRLWWARRTGKAKWVRSSLLGAGVGYELDVPAPMAGLEILEVPAPWLTRTVGIAVIRDSPAGTFTAVVRAQGRGFPLSSPGEQDGLLASWGGALAPFARERAAVTRICWQEWAHPIGADGHRQFLVELGVLDRTDAETVDYLGLVEAQGRSTVTHDVLLTITIDQRRVRSRRATTAVDASIEALIDEVQLFTDRLATAGLTVDEPLTPAEVSTAVRLRSDPSRARQTTAISRSLAAATGRDAIEWGPMATEATWGHAAVDGSLHRCFRVATWPMLPVGADWLGPLIGAAGATRTVTVVMEPVPTSKAARLADREVMGREADADMKERRGFRVSARDRKRMADVVTREQELTQGHPEFRFVGLVDVSAPDLDSLEDACAAIEQSAAQSLVDLRPLEARHDRGWVANLPLGRNLAPGRALA